MFRVKYPSGGKRPASIPAWVVAVAIAAYAVGFFQGRLLSDAAAIVETTRELHNSSAALLLQAREVANLALSVIGDLGEIERDSI